MFERANYRKVISPFGTKKNVFCHCVQKDEKLNPSYCREN